MLSSLRSPTSNNYRLCHSVWPLFIAEEWCFSGCKEDKKSVFLFISKIVSVWCLSKHAVLHFLPQDWLQFSFYAFVRYSCIRPPMMQCFIIFNCFSSLPHRFLILRLPFQQLLNGNPSWKKTLSCPSPSLTWHLPLPTWDCIFAAHRPSYLCFNMTCPVKLKGTLPPSL